MNVVTVLHNKAMEFADEALLASMEGDVKASYAFFRKAFELEKEAALSVNTLKDDSLSRLILIRSAATLAIRCKEWEDARDLIAKGLDNDPPVFLLEELKTLEKELPKAYQDRGHLVEMIGTITSADAENNEIKLEEVSSHKIYTITVPTNLINHIVRSYWADLVQIKVEKTASGRIVLNTISKAA